MKKEPMCTCSVMGLEPSIDCEIHASFNPDWTTPPGATIKDILDERKMTVTDFANKMEFSVSEANKLIDGTNFIDYTIAEKLVNLFGSSVGFWVRREANHRRRLQKLHGQEIGKHVHLFTERNPVALDFCLICRKMARDVLMTQPMEKFQVG